MLCLANIFLFNALHGNSASFKDVRGPFAHRRFHKISPRSAIAMRNMLASFYSVRGFEILTPPGWKIMSRLLVVAIIRICRPLPPCPEDVPCYGDRRTVDVFRINYVTWNLRRNVFPYVTVRRMSIMSLQNKAEDSENGYFIPTHCCTPCSILSWQVTTENRVFAHIWTIIRGILSGTEKKLNSGLTGYQVYRNLRPSIFLDVTWRKLENVWWCFGLTYRGADKFIAWPGRKQATVTKL